MTKPQVFAIILNWNGQNDTLNCLKSLAKADTTGVFLSVIVVDNNSTDGSVRQVSKLFPSVFLLPQQSNLGFSGGINRGIRYALKNGADYIWILNNDTVVDRRSLDFLTVFKDPEVGAVGSKIYFSPGHEYHFNRYNNSERGKVIWYAGGIIDWQNMYASHRGVDEVDHGQYETTGDTQFITGCSFAVRAGVVRQIGYFDERYYLYLEDVDYSLRIQRAGFRTAYCPQSVIWHLNAVSSGKPGNRLHEYYFTRNRMLLGFNYAPVRTKFALIREAGRILLGKSALRRKAIIDAILGKFGRQYEPE